MAADTFDPILGLILQGTGNNNNNWGVICDNQMISPAARGMAGVNTHTDVGGTVDLSASPPPAALRQDIDYIQKFTGALTSDLTFVVPAISKTWLIWNATSNAFNLFMKITGGAVIQIPQGTIKLVISDGTNLVRGDDEDIGAFRYSGKAAAGAGELACDGSSKLRTAFPNLFAKIGTTWGSADGTHFTLPNLTDTGRFLRSSSGTLTVGTYQANTVGSHTHPSGATYSGTTSNESADHTHGGSGTTGTENQVHTHNAIGNGGNTSTGGGGFPCAAPLTSTTTGNENQNHNHSFSFTTSGISNTHTHSYSGTVGAIPANTGTTETRPEAAVALICIRY